MQVKLNEYVSFLDNLKGVYLYTTNVKEYFDEEYPNDIKILLEEFNKQSRILGYLDGVVEVPDIILTQFVRLFEMSQGIYKFYDASKDNEFLAFSETSPEGSRKITVHFRGFDYKFEVTGKEGEGNLVKYIGNFTEKYA